MTKGELLQLDLTLKEVKDLGTMKFRYNILRNIEYLSSQVKTLKILEEDARSVLRNFEEPRNKLILKFGTKNADGSVSVLPNSENYEEFKIELEKLLEEHKEAISAFSLKQEEFEKILLEEVSELNPLKVISIELCPEMSLKHLETLMNFNIIVD